MDLTQISTLLTHWPFAVSTLIFMVVGQVLKTKVFPKNGWYTKKPVWLFWWGYKTLGIQLAVLGMVLGAVLHNPTLLAQSIAGSMAYFGVSGALSVWGYEVLKGLLKKKGIDLAPIEESLKK